MLSILIQKAKTAAIGALSIGTVVLAYLYRVRTRERNALRVKIKAREEDLLNQNELEKIRNLERQVDEDEKDRLEKNAALDRALAARSAKRE